MNNVCLRAVSSDCQIIIRFTFKDRVCGTDYILFTLDISNTLLLTYFATYSNEIYFSVIKTKFDVFLKFFYVLMDSSKDKLSPCSSATFVMNFYNFYLFIPPDHQA